MRLRDKDRELANLSHVERAKWLGVVKRIERLCLLQLRDLHRALQQVRQQAAQEISLEVQDLRRQFYRDFEKALRLRGGLSQACVLQEAQQRLNEALASKAGLAQELEIVRRQAAQAEHRVAHAEQVQREARGRQRREVMQVLETAKQEVQRKYQEELRRVKRAIAEFKQRFAQEMLGKEKELRQLHLQHQLEKSQLAD